MHRLENGSSMQIPVADQMIFRRLPEECAWLASVTEHRGLGVLGIWQKRRRLDPRRIELTGRRQKPCEVFSAGYDIRET